MVLAYFHHICRVNALLELCIWNWATKCGTEKIHNMYAVITPTDVLV